MPLLDLRGNSLGRVIGIVGALAFLVQGYDQAVGNGLLTLQTFISAFPQIDTVNTTGHTKSHNATIQGTTIAIYEVGCAIGSLTCGIVGDILGRRKTIFLAGCVSLVGVIIQASTYQLGQLIAGRIITGMLSPFVTYNFKG
ncbi:hypothetical protein DH86_00003299 [Scytalidium sp. 3C]|nr:hypothetical protein DH86_00003299 [Scytalidium sp. 3C]